MSEPIEVSLEQLDDFLGWEGSIRGQPYVLDNDRIDNGNPIYAFSDASSRHIEPGDHLDLISPDGSKNISIHVV